MPKILNKIKEILITEQKQRIIFCEGWNKKIQEAASKLRKENLLEPILMFKNKNDIPTNFDGKSFVIESKDLTKYSNLLFELRKEKGMTLVEAEKLVKEPNFLAPLMIKLNEADGEVCGIEYTTKDTLKPALQISKTAKGAKLVSSIMILEKDDDFAIFSDCAININPNYEELANIALMTGQFATNFLKIDKPKIAMLSYSTCGSGVGESVDKVRKAVEFLSNNEEAKRFDIFGEIQFDAAYSSEVRAKKAKTCKWDKKPEIFIVPNIDVGNIGYKIAQRMGGYNAFGPALVGLGAAINDLSRGANIEDVIGVAYLTAAQAIISKK